jgi:hypothetical protein
MRVGRIDGVPYSVPDGFEVVSADRLAQLHKFATLVSDLDRNFEGRHEGDVSSGEPTGVSQGNPILPVGMHIGYTLARHRRIVVPPREVRHDPDAWLVE